VPVEELGLLMAGVGGDGAAGDQGEAAEAAEHIQDSVAGQSDPSEPVAGPS
jgi:hypothetical protein